MSAQGAVDIGVVAIEISTGDVLHAQFRWGRSGTYGDLPILHLNLLRMMADCWMQLRSRSKGLEA